MTRRLNEGGVHFYFQKTLRRLNVERVLLRGIGSKPTHETTSLFSFPYYNTCTCKRLTSIFLERKTKFYDFFANFLGPSVEIKKIAYFSFSLESEWNVAK